MQTTQKAITLFDDAEARRIYSICYTVLVMLKTSCNDDFTSGNLKLVSALFEINFMHHQNFQNEVRTVAGINSIKCVLELIYGKFLANNFLNTKIAHNETGDITISKLATNADLKPLIDNFVERLKSIDANNRFNILFSAMITLAESLKKKCDKKLAFDIRIRNYSFHLITESNHQFEVPNGYFHESDKKIKKIEAGLEGIGRAYVALRTKEASIIDDAKSRVTEICKEIFESVFKLKTVYTYMFVATIKSLASDNNTVTIAITKTNETVVNRAQIVSYKDEHDKSYHRVNPKKLVEFHIDQFVIIRVEEQTENAKLRDVVLLQSCHTLFRKFSVATFCQNRFYEHEAEEFYRSKIYEAIKFCKKHFSCYAREIEARENDIIRVYIKCAQSYVDQEKEIREKKSQNDKLLKEKNSLAVEMATVKDFVFARYIMGEFLQKLLLEFADQLANKMHELFSLDIEKLNWFIGLFKITSDLLHEEKYLWLNYDFKRIYSKIEEFFLNVLCGSIVIKPEDVTATFGSACEKVREFIEDHASGIDRTRSNMWEGVKKRSVLLEDIQATISDSQAKIQAEIDEIQKLLDDNNLTSIGANCEFSYLKCRGERLEIHISDLKEKSKKLDELESQVKLFEVEKVEVDRVMKLIPISIDGIGRAEEQLTVASEIVNVFCKRVNEFVKSSRIELILYSQPDFEYLKLERRSFQILFEMCTLEIRCKNDVAGILMKREELEKTVQVQDESMLPVELQCVCIETLTDRLYNLFSNIESQCHSKRQTFLGIQHSIFECCDDDHEQSQNDTQILLQNLRDIRFDDTTAKFEEIHEVIAERAKRIKTLRGLLKKVGDLESTHFRNLKLMNLDFPELEANYGQVQDQVRAHVFEKTSATAITDALMATDRLMTALYKQKGKLTQTQTELDEFKSNFESIVEKLHNEADLNDEMIRELQSKLNDLHTRLPKLEDEVHDLNSKTNCNEMIHQAASGCEKLLLAAPIVEAISKLNNTVNLEQEEMNSESKIESRYERITIAIIIIFCVVVCSVTATFFTIEKLLRFSMQVSMSFCAAGFIAMIIALSLLVRENFQIESLTKRNDADRGQLSTMNQNLNSIIPAQELENWRRILQNDIPIS